LVTSQKNNSLELVHVLFRHGDRTPDKRFVYPYDPHVNATYHPVGYGQLTNVFFQGTNSPSEDFEF
jgi:prostatic aicd phosphatase